MGRLLANSKTKIYVIVVAAILILSSASIVSTWFLDAESFSISGLLFELGVEGVGVALAVLLVDLFVQRHDERKRLARQDFAIQSLRIPLMHHSDMLFNFYKASLEKRPSRPAMSYESLFASNYFSQVAFLDLSNPAPIYDPDKDMTWMDYISEQFKYLEKKIEGVIQKYSTDLDLETIQGLEDLCTDSFAGFGRGLSMTYKGDLKDGHSRAYNFFASPEVTEMLKEHTERLLEVLDFCNQRLSGNRKIQITSESWRNDIEPSIGSSRITPEKLKNSSALYIGESLPGIRKTDNPSATSA